MNQQFLTPLDIENIMIACAVIVFALSKLAVIYTTPIVVDLLNEHVFNFLVNITLPNINTEWNRLITDVESARVLVDTLLQEAQQLPNRFVSELEISRGILITISQVIFNYNEAINTFIASVNSFVQNPTIGSMADLIQTAQNIHNNILNIITHVSRLQDVSHNSFNHVLEENYDNIVQRFDSFIDQTVRIGQQATDCAQVPLDVIDTLKDIGPSLSRY